MHIRDETTIFCFGMGTLEHTNFSVTNKQKVNYKRVLTKR